MPAKAPGGAGRSGCSGTPGSRTGQRRLTFVGGLVASRPEEVFMLFGDKLTTIDPGDYSTEQRYDALASTAALPLITAIAEQLGATLA